MGNKTVKEIIEEMESETTAKIVGKYLVANGFDGLYNESIDCACKIDDLAPCGGISMGCTAGYIQPLEPYSEYDFVIGERKHKDTKGNGE